MPAPKKPKAEALRQARQKAPQSREDGSGAKHRDYSGYREPETVTLSTRLDRADRDAIERHAKEHGLKAGQVVRSWILEAMRREGLR